MAELCLPIWFSGAPSARARAMAAAEHPADDGPDEEAEAAQRASRQRRPRGGKVADVSGTPERETR